MELPDIFGTYPTVAPCFCVCVFTILHLGSGPGTGHRRLYCTCVFLKKKSGVFGEAEKKSGICRERTTMGKCTFDPNVFGHICVGTFAAYVGFPFLFFVFPLWDFRPLLSGNVDE